MYIEWFLYILSNSNKICRVSLTISARYEFKAIIFARILKSGYSS